VFRGKKVGRAKLGIKVYLVPKVRLEPPAHLAVPQVPQVLLEPVKPDPSDLLVELLTTVLCLV
jgi:hypothetical protein